MRFPLLLTISWTRKAKLIYGGKGKDNFKYKKIKINCNNTIFYAINRYDIEIYKEIMPPYFNLVF